MGGRQFDSGSRHHRPGKSLEGVVDNLPLWYPPGMPVCKKCEKRFPCRVEIQGRVRNVAQRKYCLECSPFGARNTTPLHLRAPKGERGSLVCSECGSSYTEKKGSNTLDLCGACTGRKSRHARKRRCVEYKGGRCAVCGYDRCLEALTFHHRQSGTKLFTISGSHSRSWKSVQQELDKCDLVCQNCHHEIHAGVAQLAEQPAYTRCSA